MTKYSILLNILDRIRDEAATTQRARTYLPPAGDAEQINQARSRSFIHLYLKVSFGLLDFNEREHFMTDGPYDGGIDGYYIDAENKLIYLIQSKFRGTERNFADKQIALRELLAMDVVRILDGHEQDENNNNYNGKILQLQREIRQIEDIARYKYKVILLANVEEIPRSHLSKLVGGLPCEVFNYEKCYRLLVFPVISGTYFNATDLIIHLDLSNKNAGSKISYTVDTQYGECDITVLFVPTLEIAKTFHRYKNSILKFNPRSYLELEGAKVNAAIRNTILQEGKNEFALYNNGITMLSDETNLNEKIGQRNKAQLNVRNPQIINGGQTAYTLSRIYEETDEGRREAIFAGKEVLLKLITVNAGSQGTEQAKINLIDAISVATNQQTVVITADRYSNEQLNLDLQKRLFERYGLLYERKRGEFQDGIYQRYIERGSTIERNLFFRILLAANGDMKRAIEKKAFARALSSSQRMPTDDELDRFYFATLVSPLLFPGDTIALRGNRLLAAKFYAMTTWYIPRSLENAESAAVEAAKMFPSRWDKFIESMQAHSKKFIRTRKNKKTGEEVLRFDTHGLLISHEFKESVKKEGRLATPSL